MTIKHLCIISFAYGIIFYKMYTVFGVLFAIYISVLFSCSFTPNGRGGDSRSGISWRSWRCSASSSASTSRSTS